MFTSFLFLNGALLNLLVQIALDYHDYRVNSYTGKLQSPTSMDLQQTKETSGLSNLVGMLILDYPCCSPIVNLNPGLTDTGSEGSTLQQL